MEKPSLAPHLSAVAYQGILKMKGEKRKVHRETEANLTRKEEH